MWIQIWVTVWKRSIRGKIGDSLSCVTLKFDWWPLKIIGHLFYTTLSFVQHFKAIGIFKLEVQSGNAQFRSKLATFIPHALEKWRMNSKNNRAPLVAASSFVHHFKAIGEFKLELQSGNTQFGSKSTIFLAVWLWNLTDDLENNRASLLRNIKLCASFHHHMWIQTGVTVRKRLNEIMTSVTLTLDIWPFAWTSHLSMVITPENFRMMPWQEHCQKGVILVCISVQIRHIS